MNLKNRSHLIISLICIGFIALVFLIYVGRLVQWQIIDGDKYQEMSEENSNYYIKIEAARGEIFDCNGNTLAGNKTVYSIVINAITMDDDRNAAIAASFIICRKMALSGLINCLLQ